MNLEQPWDAIHIELVQSDRTFQYFDSDIYILYLLSGYAYVSIEDQQIHLSSDDFVILPKGIPSSVKIDQGHLFLYRIQYSFPIDKLNKYYYVFTGDSVQNGSSKSITVIDILQKLMQCYIFKYERPRSRVCQYYFELIAVLEENFCIKRSFDADESIYQKVEALSVYIRNNSENEMRLSAIAKQLFVSEQYLSKMFRKIKHESLSDYIVRCRMEQVIKLLQSTNLTITDIALSAGFTNINSFNRLFKHRFQQTPKEYRNQWMKKTTEQVNEQNNDIDAIKHLLKEEKQSNKELSISLYEHELQNANSVRFLIGAGDIYRLAEEPLFHQIRQLDHLGFTYVSLSGWLQKPQFDFYKIDMVIDALISYSLLPYIECDVTSYLHQPEKLRKPIHTLLQHFLKNYGKEHVEKWMVSIVVDEEINQRSIEEFHQLYTCYQSIHSLWHEILPEASIGIGSLRGDLTYEGFLNYHERLSEAELPDFFAVMMYQVDQDSEIDQKGLMEGKASPDPGFMKRKLLELKQATDAWNTKLIITDFNVVPSHQLHTINDSAFKGPYLLKNILDMMKAVEVIGYGTFSDQMYRQYDTKNEVFGAPGLLSLHGFMKPGFLAFQFLFNTCKYDVSIDKDYMIRMDEDRKHIRLLMYQYSHLGIHYYYNTMNFHRYNINKAFEKQKEQVYHIDLSHLLQEDKAYKVKFNTIGIDKGSLLDELNRYTRLDILTSDDIAYLKHNIRPMKHIDFLHKDHMKINMKIKSHEAVYIEVDEITQYDID